jgi:hypothetical protein
MMRALNARRWWRVAGLALVLVLVAFPAVRAAGLRYPTRTLHLRDKEKREVDFLKTVDGTPTLLVEVTSSRDTFSRHLTRFAGYFPAAGVVQVVHGPRRRKASGRLVGCTELLDISYVI